MESRESKNLLKLNQDYFDVYYSSAYQKYLNKKTRKMNIKMVWNQIKTGYFIHRIGTMFFPDVKNNISYVQDKSVCDIGKAKIAVYTVIIGKYDELKEPLYISSQCDYFLVTDSDIDVSNSVWEKIDINNLSNINMDGYSNTKKARYIKTHPHKLFSNYEYSIFLDGNFLIVADLVPMVEMLGEYKFATHLHPTNCCIYKEARDIIALNKENEKKVKQQIECYKKEGFPAKYGLFETNVLVRKHNSKECVMVDEEWWNQMEHFTLRDQLSLTYVLWKLSFGIGFVKILGDNPRKNPRLRYLLHADNQ